MLPEEWMYGGWPKSGEIDIVEIIGIKFLKFSLTNYHQSFEFSPHCPILGEIVSQVLGFGSLACEANEPIQA